MRSILVSPQRVVRPLAVYSIEGAMDIAQTIAARLAALPEKPGVYLMRDANNRVIYVGKAIVLRNRVRSYFHQSAGHTPKTERLVAEIADLEWIVTESELEALILEAELIKRYRPRYNVRLKDDKRYPYIKVSMQEDFPHIYTVRKMEQDGARYFGPFTSSQAVYQSLELLRRLFPYRTCNRVITGQDPRPCLYYHIKLCTGPCIGAIDRAATAPSWSGPVSFWRVSRRRSSADGGRHAPPGGGPQL